jgi:hypothetical protein
MFRVSPFSRVKLEAFISVKLKVRVSKPERS